MKSKLLLISILSLLITACASPAESVDLPTQLHNHLSETAQSYENADIIWQKVLDGDPAVSCAVNFAVPVPFDLNVTEAEKQPQSVIVRDHLNNAIASLSEIKRLWDLECQQPEPTIPLNTIRLVIRLLSDAEAEIRAADEAWAAWQS